MNDEMYRNKYLKYKNKYIALQNKDALLNKNQAMNGGGGSFFDNIKASANQDYNLANKVLNTTVKNVSKTANQTISSITGINMKQPTVEPTVDPTVEPTVDSTVDPTVDPTVDYTNIDAIKCNCPTQNIIDVLDLQITNLKAQLSELQKN